MEEVSHNFFVAQKQRRGKLWEKKREKERTYQTTIALLVLPSAFHGLFSHYVALFVKLPFLSLSFLLVCMSYVHFVPKTAKTHTLILKTLYSNMYMNL